MKVTLWGINYAPELTGIGPFNQALCEYLAAQGHDVEVVTGFAYYPEWKKRDADRRQIFRTDLRNGVRIHRCWHYVPAKVRALRRMLHEATFVALSLLRVLSLARPDVYVVVSPPLSLGVAAWLAGLIKRRPFVFHVQDLQPDAAVGLGMLQKGIFTRLLYGMESFAYARAARISGISAGMLQMFRKKGFGEDQIVYFPNGVTLPLELPARGAFRLRHKIPADDFLAIYSGNLGVKQGLDVLLEAARRLGERQREIVSACRPIRIVIAGDGARRAHLAEMIDRFDLNNVLLLSLLPDLEYREMLADADCCLITQQQGTGSFFFPSKLLASLAAAKPVLTVADDESELARAVHEGRFGVNVLPEQPEALALAIQRMAAAQPDLEAAVAPVRR